MLQFGAAWYAASDALGTLMTHDPGSPENALAEIVGGVVGRTCKSAKLVHPLNADPLMLVTDAGIVRDVALDQPWNALTPIDVTVSGNVRDVALVQSRNALDPMLVMLAPVITSDVGLE